jgi:hypothetical protein
MPTWINLRPWRCRQYIPPKHRRGTTGLHGVTTQTPSSDTKCIMLGHWWHHSIWYTVYLRFQQSSLQSLFYKEFWPSDVLSRSGPLISSSECWQLTDCLLVTNWLLLAHWHLVTDYLLSRSTPLSRYIRTGYRTPSLTVYLPSQQFDYLRNA